MIADGLTKGSIDRALLHKACKGIRTLVHKTERLTKDTQARKADAQDARSSNTIGDESMYAQVVLLGKVLATEEESEEFITKFIAALFQGSTSRAPPQGPRTSLNL